MDTTQFMGDFVDSASGKYYVKDHIHVDIDQLDSVWNCRTYPFEISKPYKKRYESWIKNLFCFCCFVVQSALQNCVIKYFAQLMAWYLGIIVIIQTSCLSQQLRFVLLALYIAGLQLKSSPPPWNTHTSLLETEQVFFFLRRQGVCKLKSERQQLLFFWSSVVHYTTMTFLLLA